MGLSLTTITADLETLIAQYAELVEQREELVGRAFLPTQEAKEDSNLTVEEVDAAIEQTVIALRQYSEDLLPNKVDAYWWTLKKIGKKDDSKPLEQQTGIIADAKREIKRLQKLVDDNDKLQEMLRENVLGSMRTLDKKVLEGTNGRKLRRQNNGGVVPVEVVQPELVPQKFEIITVRLPMLTWLSALYQVEQYAGADGATLSEMKAADLKAAAPDPDLTAIRKELEKKVPCPAKCAAGFIPPFNQDICPTCNGEGAISNGVPGCRLATRGEHVRVV